MLRVRIFQVEVVMAHILETSVLCPGPAGLGCWPWVVAGIQTTGHSGRPEGGLVKESSVSRSVVLHLPNAVAL